MSTFAWKRFLLSICALTLVLCAIELWTSTAYEGLFGVSAVAATGVPFHSTILVHPNSPAWSSGLRSGDVVDIKAMASTDRFRLFNYPRTGDRLHLIVVNHNRIRRVTVTATNFPYRWDAWVGYFGFLWMALFATLLSWKRPDHPEARALALLLTLFVLSSIIASNNWQTPWPLADAFAQTISYVLAIAAYTLLATYAALFARPASPPRLTLTLISYIVAAASALYAAAIPLIEWTAIVDPTGPVFSSPAAQIGGSLPYILLPLLCAVAAIAQTRGVERTRLLWAATPLCLYYVTALATAVTQPFNLPWFRIVYAVGNVSVFVTPLGLTYSLLNRRLLDIGFVLNRAAVFSVVSIVLVGTFVLAEWLMTEWLRDASHTTNIAISAGLALSLGLSVRFVHARVDRILDTVFFRKRHEDEQAIRTFAHEAAYITDAHTVVQRAISTLEGHADASFVTFALDDGTDRYDGVDENDPAIVALRAWRKPLDLHTVESQLSGDFAYPMIARGRLVGALVLGPKRSGDSYAPDESDAIAQLAHSVGAALDMLSINGESAPHSFAHLTETLRAAVYEAVSDGFERLGQRSVS